MSPSSSDTFFLKLTLKGVPGVDEEIVTLKLFELGAYGVSQDLTFIQESQQYDPEIIETNKVNLQAFFKIDKKKDVENSALVNEFESIVAVEKNQDWLEEWKKHFKAFEVFNGLWIVPSWEKISFENKGSDNAIYIEPGLAFGTGTHATTKLCLGAINSLFKANENTISSALDLGSGSSVLSIFLKQKKVKSVLACEVDSLARENGAYNLSLNDISDVEVCDPESDLMNQEFDLVVANIIDGVLLKLKDSIFAKNPKNIILSGILTENKRRLVEAFTSDTGYDLLDSGESEEWSFLHLQKAKLGN